MKGPRIKVLHPEEGVTIFYFEDAFEGAEAVENSQALIEKVRAVTTPRLLFDLARIRYIDSAAVGVLISASNAAAAQNLSFGLINVARAVRKVLEVTHIDRIITVYGHKEH